VAYQSKKLWKYILISLAILAPFFAWLGFGERGLFHLYRTEMERQMYIDRIYLLAEENQSLLEEVNRLGTDMEYVESLARNDLNLVKPNEIVYRFKKEKK